MKKTIQTYTYTTTRGGKKINKSFNVGTKDSSEYSRVLQKNGVWKITKHSDSFLNGQRLAALYTQNKTLSQ